MVLGILLNYYIMSFEEAFDFKGTATREEYWLAYLSHIIVYALILFFGISAYDEYRIIEVLYGLAMNFVMLSFGIRRLHDAGTSGWVILIPVVNLIYLVKDSKC